jgi:Na+-translocating ferredoxin:NAD+ oxidoreductase subunit B
MMSNPESDNLTRRQFLTAAARYGMIGGAVCLGGAQLFRTLSASAEQCRRGGSCANCPSIGDCGLPPAIGDASGMVWQIDPTKCNACGNCATYCVLQPSAVKCVHTFPMCGYCELCFAFFQPKATNLDAGADNQLCPTGAIERKLVEPPYYEYKIDEPLCVGCAKCVKGCTTFGNGSLFMQVRHDRCMHCNQCAIAAACPANAFVRVPATRPYILKGKPILKGPKK